MKVFCFGPNEAGDGEAIDKYVPPNTEWVVYWYRTEIYKGEPTEAKGWACCYADNKLYGTAIEHHSVYSGIYPNYASNAWSNILINSWCEFSLFFLAYYLSDEVDRDAKIMACIEELLTGKTLGGMNS